MGREGNGNFSLWQIDQQILDCVDMETGEIIDETRLEQLSMARDDKIEGIALWIKQLRADAEQIKAEAQALQIRQKAKEKKADSLAAYLSRVLDGQKFETAKAAISFRKSESVNITDPGALLDFSDTFFKFADPTPDKTKIKAALKAGVKLPGAEIQENRNIQIK